MSARWMVFGFLGLLGCGGNVSTGGAGGGGGAATTTVTTGTMTGTTTVTTTTTTTGGGCGTGCGAGLVCCGSTCVNLENDLHNCGACGAVCPTSTPYCHLGVCATPPCNATCGANCCGDKCCGQGELCCDIMMGPAQFAVCTPADMNGTCPPGCPACVCASPDTPIATPQGERPIADIAVGDLVYSVDHGAVVAVPVLRVNRAPVTAHSVVRVSLKGGRVLEISARHPTADGRMFADLRAGDALDGTPIKNIEVVPYAHAFTYDILPASDTGTYYAAGARIGSTLPR